MCTTSKGKETRTRTGMKRLYQNGSIPRNACVAHKFISKCDYQERVTPDRHATVQTDTGQIDPYVLLCFAGDIKSKDDMVELHVLMHTSTPLVLYMPPT